jgi:hypothetical protein
MDILTIIFAVASLLLSLAWLMSAANHRRVAQVAASPKVNEPEVASDRNAKAALGGAMAVSRLFLLFIILLPYLTWIDGGSAAVRDGLFIVWVVIEGVSWWAWRKTI